ncbi:hypothetical protein ACJZ2D_010806 [Fusarium nematophilum]
MVADDASSADGNLVWKEYEPKAWEETDVDIKVTHSGICGSDLHTLRNGWGTSKFPCVAGHEIAGVVVRGGYALYHRCPAHFVIRIPEGMTPEHAAPMLWGGVTVYSPLKRHGVGPGKAVGIIGVGGLGHFAILFAKALGARKVVAISRRSDKKSDALSLGADNYVASSEGDEWAAIYSRSLDLIIDTVSTAKMPLQQFLGPLALGGTLVQIGAPEEPLSLSAFSLIRTRACMAGSVIGSPREIREMLQLPQRRGSSRGSRRGR